MSENDYRWFEDQWRMFLMMSLAVFIEKMKSGTLTRNEKARFLLRIAEEINVKAEQLVTTKVEWRE